MDQATSFILTTSTLGTYDLFELIGILVTKGRGSIHHSTHNANAIVTSSMHAELIASNRAGNIVVYARVVDTALGTPPSRPTLVGTDALSHAQVANRLASSNRSKPFLKNYVVQMQRIHDELISIARFLSEVVPHRPIGDVRSFSPIFSLLVVLVCIPLRCLIVL